MEQSGLTAEQIVAIVEMAHAIALDVATEEDY